MCCTNPTSAIFRVTVTASLELAIGARELAELDAFPDSAMAGVANNVSIIHIICQNGNAKW